MSGDCIVAVDMDKMKKVFNNERGLTLVELAVVLIIFGALLVYLVPKFGAMIDKSKVAGVKSDFKIYQLAAETTLRDYSADVYGGSINTYALDENLDQAYHFRDDDGISFRDDPWKNGYKVEIYQATEGFVEGSTGEIVSAGLPALNQGTSLNDGLVIYRSAGKDGAFSTGLTDADIGDDHVLAVYYREGTVDTCTSGFGNSSAYLDSLVFADSNVDHCGAPVL